MEVMANAENDIIVQGVTTTDPVINIGGGYDILTPILWWLGDLTGVGGSGSGLFASSGFLGAIMAVFLFVWNVFAFIAFIFALLFLFLFVMATVKKAALKEALTAQLRAAEVAFAGSKTQGVLAGRFAVLQDNVDSSNPNDWKLAIIEADVILDETIRERGYPGNSLGERLRSISPMQLATLDDAWQAHKVRNQIAHSGADFILTQKIAKETLARYQRVFSELGIL